MNTHLGEKGRVAMGGHINVDTTSEQHRLEELAFRNGLYCWVEAAMFLCAVVLASSSVVMGFIWNGLGGVVTSLFLGVFAVIFVGFGVFTRMTRRMAESEVQAIKLAIDKVTGF